MLWFGSIPSIGSCYNIKSIPLIDGAYVGCSDDGSPTGPFRDSNIISVYFIFSGIQAVLFSSPLEALAKLNDDNEEDNNDNDDDNDNEYTRAGVRAQYLGCV